LGVRGRDAEKSAAGPKDSMLPGTGAQTKDRAMRRFPAIVLAVGVLLVVSGCAGWRRGEKVSLLGDSGPSPDSKSAHPQDSPPRPCLERHGFAVFSFRAIRDDYERVSVVGEVKNTGPAARGVELQATLRDANGRVMAVGHFCPASNRNIAPGEMWPFTYPFGLQGDAVEAELRIVGAFRTTDILNAPTTAR